MSKKRGAPANPRFYPPDLAAFRESKGISLEAIAQSTKISIYYLRAIESAEFGKLPGGVFTTSYIRQYARAIAYDEEHLLACYREVMGIDDRSDGPGGAGGTGREPSPWLRLFAPERKL